VRARTLSLIIFGLAVGLLIANLLPLRYDRSASPDVEHRHDKHQAIYTCPMHPEIRQKEPGTCPICHMELVVVGRGEEGEIGADEPAAIPLDPYQASLLGLKPIHPKKEKVNRNLPVYGVLVQKNLLGVQVFEDDLRNIRVGLEFTGSSSVYPEQKLQGEVIEFDSVLDPSTRTLRVLIRLQTQKGMGQLPIESSASGQLRIPLGEQLTLPEETVLFAGSGNYVYLYQDEHLIPQKVVLGAKIDGRYVIVKGLDVTDAVSSGPNFFIDSEAKIRGLDDSKVD